MKPSQRMQPALELARERLRTAALKLADVQFRYEQKQQKLRELESYRDEYMHGLLRKSRDGLQMVQMKDYNLFLDRLNQAIHQQHHMLEGMKVEVDQCAQQWRQEQVRVDALDKVVERKVQSERREVDRLEQLECNEHARRGWRRELT
ncbi:MAG: flagellar export protein FliJ [Gammaproteobacteria bacterium]